jgi:hypothetical protein
MQSGPEPALAIGRSLAMPDARQCARHQVMALASEGAGEHYQVRFEKREGGKQ